MVTDHVIQFHIDVAESWCNDTMNEELKDELTMSDETPLPFSPLSFSKEYCKGSCFYLNTTISEVRKARAVRLNTTHSFIKLTLRTLVLAPSSLGEIPWTKDSIHYFSQWLV